MSEPQTITITTDDREALVIALRSPGWATALDLIGDGTDALKWLRDSDLSGPIAVPNKWVADALKLAVTSAIQRGVFGPGEALVALCDKIGLKRSERRI